MLLKLVVTLSMHYPNFLLTSCIFLKCMLRNGWRRGKPLWNHEFQIAYRTPFLLMYLFLAFSCQGQLRFSLSNLNLQGERQGWSRTLKIPSNWAYICGWNMWEMPIPKLYTFGVFCSKQSKPLRWGRNPQRKQGKLLTGVSSHNINAIGNCNRWSL